MASWLSKRSASTLPEAWRVPTLEQSDPPSQKDVHQRKKGVVYGGFFKVQIFWKIPQNNPTGHSDPIHRLWSSRKKIMNHRCYYRIYTYIYFNLNLELVRCWEAILSSSLPFCDLYFSPTIIYPFGKPHEPSTWRRRIPLAASVADPDM